MKTRYAVAIALLTATLAARTGILLQQAPASYVARTNPLASDERNRLAGAKLYEHECAACHGQARQGIGHAPRLDRAEIRTVSPGVLFWVLRNGSLWHGMPSFAHIPEPEKWQIVTFLQSKEK